MQVMPASACAAPPPPPPPRSSRLRAGAALGCALVIRCAGALGASSCGIVTGLSDDYQFVDSLPDGAPSDAASDGGPGSADAARDARPDAGGGPLTCRGAADCPLGTVCCGYLQGGAPASTCKANCGGPDEAQLCDPNAPVSGCPPGSPNACTTATNGDWGLPNGYGTCGQRCPGGC